jgi:hypothetical protein
MFHDKANINIEADDLISFSLVLMQRRTSGLLDFLTLSNVWIKLDLFPPSGEGVGDTYFVGSVGKS